MHKDWKIRTAKKLHACDYCNNPIQKGEQYRYIEGREPRYDKNEHQIGIAYFKCHCCLDLQACTRRFEQQEDV